MESVRKCQIIKMYLCILNQLGFLFLQAVGLQVFAFPDFAHHQRRYSCRGNMGTQGSGRKRAPLKDRFSAEDEALSSIAREVSSYSRSNVFLF